MITKSFSFLPSGTVACNRSAAAAADNSNFVVGGWHNTVSGFQMINGRWADSNPTTAKARRWLVGGKRHVFVVKVRKDGVEGWLDDEPIAATRPIGRT